MAATKKMDAVALLKADHRKVEDLFKKFTKTRDSRTKQSLAKEICTELTVHATIEEEIFYPACNGKVEDDLQHESYVEHDGAKVLIAELEASSPDNEFYDAKMTALCEQIKHHVKEEAVGRVDTMQRDTRATVERAANAARKAASYASLWTGFSLLFGLIVAIFAAVSARIEDDREMDPTRL